MAKTSSYSGKAGIRVSVNFNGLLEKIHEAGGNAEQAMWDAARKGARVLKDELVAESNASGVPTHLTDKIAMQADRDGSGNRVACKVGWRMSEYNPHNIADEYKVIFMNYGTPRRTAKSMTHAQVNGEWKTTANRGYMDARGFIGRAKKQARPKIKKVQEQCLKEILEGLPRK